MKVFRPFAHQKPEPWHLESLKPNNASGKIGLVDYWDCVCFDEFAGKDKKVDKNLVDIMINYMANQSFSRGIEMLGAEASVVFMGNTKKSAPYMMKHSHFFEELPDKSPFSTPTFARSGRSVISWSLCSSFTTSHRSARKRKFAL